MRARIAFIAGYTGQRFPVNGYTVMDTLWGMKRTLAECRWLVAARHGPYPATLCSEQFQDAVQLAAYLLKFAF